MKPRIITVQFSMLELSGLIEMCAHAINNGFPGTSNPSTWAYNRLCESRAAFIEKEREKEARDDY